MGIVGSILGKEGGQGAERALARKQRRRILLYKNTAVYHVVSKTAYHDFRFSEEHKRAFRGMLQRQAIFCGVEVLAFCILDNHFHLLVRIPYRETPLTDAELIERYEALYAGKPLPESALSIEDVITILKTGGTQAKALRKQLQARMMNLSVFVKELKQRFSIWYNNHFDNVGTVWCEPFKSVLVEDTPNVLKWIAAYIDLNPVRAGICENAQDYPFSSIGEAFAGKLPTRRGLMALHQSRNWPSVQKQYLALLCTEPSLSPKETPEPVASMDPNASPPHMKDLPPGLILRQRIKAFSKGGVIGSDDFVSQIEAFLNQHPNAKKRFKPKPICQNQTHCPVHSMFLPPIPLSYRI